MLCAYVSFGCDLLRCTMGLLVIKLVQKCESKNGASEVCFGAKGLKRGFKWNKGYQ